jgi:hypothetical protein
MVPNLPAPENPGVPLRDPRDRQLLGPLSSDAPRLHPDPKPPLKPSHDPSPAKRHFKQRAAVSKSAPLPRTEERA